MSQPLIEHLNRELATAQVILLNAKRYHWMVRGPHFREYHLRFDELYQAVLPMVDELGERIRALQGVPIHTPSQLESLSAAQVSDPLELPDAAGMLREALANTEAAIALLHEGIALATAEDDPGTADLLTGFVQVHQKGAWFFRAMLG